MANDRKRQLKLRNLKKGFAVAAVGATLTGAGLASVEVVQAEAGEAVSASSEQVQEQSEYIDPVDTETEVLTGNFYPGVTIRIEHASEAFPQFFGLGTVTTDEEGFFAFELPEDVSLVAGDQLRFHGQHRYFDPNTFSFEVVVLDETVTVAQGVDLAVEAARAALADLIDDVAAEHNVADYTDESWTAFANALVAAEAERDHADATVESLENAAAALREAVDNLVTVEEAAENESPGKPSWTPGRGPRENPGKPSWTPGRGPRENPGKPSWTPGRGPGFNPGRSNWN